MAEKAKKKESKKSTKEVVETSTAKSKSESKKARADMSSVNKLRLLYELQLVDSQIDNIKMVRGELPLEVQDLEDEIEGIDTRIKNLQHEIKEIESSVAKRKIDVENSKSLIKKYVEQQNNVKNNREFDSLSKQLEFQTLEIELNEKRIKEAAQSVKDKKQDIEEAKNVLQDKRIDIEEKRKYLEEITSETAAEEQELINRSEAIKKNIEPRLLSAYKKIRNNARNGLAVVTVKRDACGGCFNKIPPQRQMDIKLSKKVIVCEYCGRILVDPDFVEE